MVLLYGLGLNQCLLIGKPPPPILDWLSDVLPGWVWIITFLQTRAAGAIHAIALRAGWSVAPNDATHSTPSSRCEYKILTKTTDPFPPSYSRSRRVGGRCQRRRRRRRTATAAVAGAAAAAADNGGIFFLKPQRSALLNKYSGGDGREVAPRGKIIGRVERGLRAIGGGGGGRR